MSLCNFSDSEGIRIGWKEEPTEVAVEEEEGRGAIWRRKVVLFLPTSLKLS